MIKPLQENKKTKKDLHADIMKIALIFFTAVLLALITHILIGDRMCPKEYVLPIRASYEDLD